MIHLTGHGLVAAHRFLLEIFRSTDPGQLRLLIPAGLSRLITCERASFNEVDRTQVQQKIVPNPVPVWWARLGDAYQAHLMDHPLLSQKHAPTLNRTVSFGDPCYAAVWKKSALNHEYFVPLGVKHQLSAMIFRTDSITVGIAINRAKKDFSPRDRALVDLLNPHLAQAWQNALSFTALRRQLAGSADGLACDQAVVTVDSARARLRPLSAGASHLLRKYFAVDSEGNGRLPEQLDRWLRAQRRHLASPEAVASPPAPLVINRPTSRLTVQLARTRPDEAILLLDDAEEPAPGHTVTPAGLTRREIEIFHWIAEGKRSTEIAVILGISARTVEKHVEHIFLKLGVETRGAAVRQAFEFRNARDARNHHG